MRRLLGVLRPFVRAARALRDGAFHPFRRARARKVALALPPIRSILFLCTGNICRSPYAEKAFARQLPNGFADRIAVRSAGFLAAGRPSPPEAIRAAERNAVALAEHRSSSIDGAMLDASDLIVVMEVAHAEGVHRTRASTPRPLLLLGDLDPDRPSRREIQDPWGHPPAVFHASFDRIDRCLAVLAELVAATHETATPNGRPRGRGEE